MRSAADEAASLGRKALVILVRALRGIDTPVAVARYVTGNPALPDQVPAEQKPALPDLPVLAQELAKTVETAEAFATDLVDADLAADRGSNSALVQRAVAPICASTAGRRAAYRGPFLSIYP